MTRNVLVFLMLSVAAAGCSDSDGGSDGSSAPSTYVVERGGESTVADLGQTTRQVVIEDLVGLMKTISSEVLSGQNLDRYDTAEEVFAFLTPLYEQGGAADPNRAIPNLVAESDSMLQSTYADLNDSDYEAFRAAIDSGRIDAAPG